MNNKFTKRLLDIWRLISFEIKSITLSIIGYVKVVFFDCNNVNKLEVGSGPNKKAGFISLDLSRKTDYPFDLRLGLPFPNKSLDLIYSEHVLEHFTYKNVLFILEEFYRSLKVGGVISIVVPNARIYLEAYSNPLDFELNKYCCNKEYSLTYKTKIDYVNYIFYMDDHHHYMFDEENIIVILKDVGFQGVRIRAFDPSLDQSERRYESLYVEGIK